MDPEHKLRSEIIVNYLREYKPEGPLMGIEIGVFTGDLIICLLEMEPRITKIWGIDPYCAGEGYRNPQEQWDIFYRKTLFSLAKFGDRATIIRDKSQYFIDYPFPKLDFVEIDGLHTYDQVSFEIHHFERLINSGGLLCGHDYFGPYHHGVKKAVRDYARFHRREVKASETQHEAGIWWWRVP